MDPRIHHQWYQDLRDLLRHELESAGFKTDADYPMGPAKQASGSMSIDYYHAWNMVYQYFNTLYRLRPGTPRTAFWSKELMEKYRVGQLLPGQISAINEISFASAEGKSLLRFMSGTIEDASYNDKMFTVWRIAHFHLDVTPSPKPKHQTDLVHFAKRTGPVLFAFIGDDGLYLLDIRNHGRQYPDAFSDRELVEILHKNWPRVIQKYRIPNASGGTAYSSETIRILRESNSNVLFTTEDGTVYHFNGILMRSGNNGEVTAWTDNVFYLCDNALSAVESDYDEIIDKIEKARGKRLSELHLTLALDQRNQPIFVEKTLGVIITQDRAPPVNPLRYPPSC